MPNMAGSPATNVIDKFGGLDATELTVDGLYAASVQFTGRYDADAAGECHIADRLSMIDVTV